MSSTFSSSSSQVNYRGVSVDKDLAGMIRHMPTVDATREALQGLQGVWDSLSLLSEMSSTGVEVASIRAAFSDLTSVLVNETSRQAFGAAALDQSSKAQVTIDILVRNLFERTADIGFLSMDEDLRFFATASHNERAASRGAIHERLMAYAAKYTVYDDIVLLSPEGEVLARLDERVALERTSDRALLSEALTTQAPYIEIYRPFDLCPGRNRTLVYACRLMDSHGTRPVGVLCLTFRFENEAELIFQKFAAVNDWSVVAILDVDGTVMASSDPFQVPTGARVGVPADGDLHSMRFGGRGWLAVSCAAQPFQGYVGPGWRGHSMTPLEHAFGNEAIDPAPVFPTPKNGNQRRPTSQALSR